MECSKCHTNNRDAASFCCECGQKLELVCSNCKNINKPHSNFCDECGQNLTLPSAPIPAELSFDEKLNKIQRYLPRGLTEKILAQKNKIEGERKQVTVMFCDMEGFTPLSEKLGMEETYVIMDQVYEILIHKVHDYEGTVNEMTGDGIMALFGAPLALEDAPQRAIRSAHAIHRAMRRLSDKMNKEKGGILQLKMRIGINTGTVVLGTLGNNLRVEFKAVGETVNLASRMEGLAEPGSTYVTDTTFKLTEGLFRFEALGDHVIKGRTGKVYIYRVIAPSNLRTRFDVSAERGLTPFQGRERELELLLDGFDRAMTSQGQAFSIMADPGLGKSRLLYEFRKAVADRDINFLEGKCLSYSRDIPNYSLIDILKSNFGIADNDKKIEIIEKIKKGLNLLKIDEEETLPYLLDFFSLKHHDTTPSMRPEALKDFTINALKQIVLKLSQIKPLIIAIEDLHWVDKNSENIFKIWLDSISGVQIFLIFTYRPEYIHQWGGKSYHNQINLNRLSNRESLSMASHLLGSSEIHRNLEELILEKTEGVPFFIEEFIKSLKVLNIIQKKNNQFFLAKNVHKVMIPSTVQDVIMARVDALPEEAKELLQLGSVIEREFSHKLIKKISKLPEPDLLSKISILKDAELIHERGIYPNSTYIFKHALTREVIFSSILSTRMEILCNDIGCAMEEIFKDSLIDQSEILAEYFIRSKNFEKGEKYLKISGQKAQKSASFANAIAYGKKRIDCLEKLLTDDNMEKRIIDARTILGLYCTQIMRPIEAKATVEPIIDLAIKQNYKRRVSQIYIIMAVYHHLIEEDYDNALNFYKKAEIIGKELKDTLTLAIVCNDLGVFLSDSGEFDKALQYFDKALEYNETAVVPWAISCTKAFMAAWAYNPQGNIALSIKTSKEALSIANESGDIYAKAHANSGLGMSYYYKGDLIKAEKNLLKAINFSQKNNLKTIAGGSSYYLGWIYFQMNEYNKAIEVHNRSISFFEQESLCPSFINASRILIARIKLMNKDKDINLNDVFQWHGNIKNKWVGGGITRSIGAILMNLDGQHLAEAEEWIKTSINMNEKYGMKWQLAKDHVMYSDWFKRQGNFVKAKSNLEKALYLFTECNADGWLEKYKIDF
jgi:class 3 adenylate cyclase/tetratricopeptide (TPR) repeat protein